MPILRFSRSALAALWSLSEPAVTAGGGAGMLFKVLKRDTGLVGIDFGFTAVKLLQLGSGDPPCIMRMGCLHFPEDIRDSLDARLDYAREHLPRIIGRLHLRGARSACSIPSSLTVVQHVQVPPSEGAELERQVRERFVKLMPCDLNNVVLRHYLVPDESRRGQSQAEAICMAVGREVVMKLVALQKACRLQPSSMHVEPLATIRAFDHITRRASDNEVTTLYLDVGGGGTKLSIAHGQALVFTKVIPIGGRQFDQRALEVVGGDLAMAHKHRMAVGFASADQRRATEAPSVTQPAALLSTGAGASGEQGALAQMAQTESAVETADERRVGQLPPEMHSLGEDEIAAAGEVDLPGIDLSDQLDALADEVSMCIRYHQSTYPDRRLDRAIFLGGESHNTDICRFIAKKLRLRAHLGDPLGRLERHPELLVEDVSLDQASLNWAVPMGLCVSPTDL